MQLERAGGVLLHPTSLPGNLVSGKLERKHVILLTF